MSKSFIPSGTELTREALIVVGGAAIAAVIIGNWPWLRDYIKRQWGDTPKPF